MATRIQTQDIANNSVTADKLAVPTTKGDILGHDATKPSRIPVGTNGQVLVADSSEELGVRWAVVARIPSFADSEVPSGTVNGSNATFTLANSPTAGSVHLYKNGLRQQPGVSADYTVVGAVVTFVSGNIPQSGDVILADYRY